MMRNVEKETATNAIKFMMRNLKIKLQSAVFNLRCETWKTNCNQQYLIDDVRPEKQTATSSI